MVGMIFQLLVFFLKSKLVSSATGVTYREWAPGAKVSVASFIICKVLCRFPKLDCHHVQSVNFWTQVSTLIGLDVDVEILAIDHLV